MKKKIRAGISASEDNPFEYFISSTQIRWCYYHETHRILGNTFGMLVLQDFEAMTPNLLARTVETIEGGGIVVLLLSSLTSLQQLYTMSMDVHDRYRTEAHQEVVCRFNERFILSLATCDACLVIDDKLNVLPISSSASQLQPLDIDYHPNNQISDDLRQLIESLDGVQPAQSLVQLCRTLDQAKAVLKFIDSLSEKTLRSTVSLTAARGRGKSAALGLAIVGAIGFNYSNIIVTSPSPENLETLFEFVIKGLEAIHFIEHIDYEIVRSSNSGDNQENKTITKVTIFKHHRQVVQYIHPDEVRKNKLSGHSAELVVIDEAAAIPLPIVKSLLGPHLVFMASTINGYEGTGRSLSLKLLQQLRNQTTNSMANKELGGRVLHEVTLEESIRYKNGDCVEKWLNNLLCLDVDDVYKPKDGDKDGHDKTGCPEPSECQLYYINRDTLFSFHEASEKFLQRLMSLYTSSHYKNSPNDLQMMSDAPAHHLFCLLPPIKDGKDKKRGKNGEKEAAKDESDDVCDGAKDKKKRGERLPKVLVFVQVCLEGEISSETVSNSLNRGRRAAGDLIPWTVSQQFQDMTFPSLAGARIIRIATNPRYQGMGYGSVAIKLLEKYFSGQIEVESRIEKNVFQSIKSGPHIDLTSSTSTSEDEDHKLRPKKELPPLLLKLDERRPELLDYLGVSFGLTNELFKFWKKLGFVPIYIRQTPNELTGENSAIVLKTIKTGTQDGSHGNNVLASMAKLPSPKDGQNQWLKDFSIDFQRRFVSLLPSTAFRTLPAVLALSVIDSCNQHVRDGVQKVTKAELDTYLTPYDLKRLELYSNNLVDYHLITDLLPTISRLFFTSKLDSDLNLSPVQSTILLNLGLQLKSVSDIESELGLQASQILGLFNRSIRKLSNCLRKISEKSLEEGIKVPNVSNTGHKMLPMVESLKDELNRGAEVIEKKQKIEFKKLSKELSKDLEKYQIKGKEEDWNLVTIANSSKSFVSIKTIAPKGGGKDGGGDKNVSASPSTDNKKRKKKEKFLKKNKNFKK